MSCRISSSSTSSSGSSRSNRSSSSVTYVERRERESERERLCCAYLFALNFRSFRSAFVMRRPGQRQLWNWYDWNARKFPLVVSIRQECWPRTAGSAGLTPRAARHWERLQSHRAARNIATVATQTTANRQQTRTSRDHKRASRSCPNCPAIKRSRIESRRIESIAQRTQPTLPTPLSVLLLRHDWTTGTAFIGTSVGGQWANDTATNLWVRQGDGEVTAALHLPNDQQQHQHHYHQQQQQQH